PEIQSHYFYFSSYYNNAQHSEEVRPVTYTRSFIETMPDESKNMAISNAQSQVRYLTDILGVKANQDGFYRDKDIRYNIEYQRKFTLAVSCLLLFCIGAPLGAIIRKGGLGLPVVVAIIFFLIYHIITTVSEKSAKEGSIDAFWGMWMAIFILSPLAIFLAYKATTDSALFDVEQYGLKAEKFWTWVKTRFGGRRKNAVQALNACHGDYTLSLEVTYLCVFQKPTMDIKLNTIEEAIEEIRLGKVVIVVADEDRENEGD